MVSKRTERTSSGRLDWPRRSAFRKCLRWIRIPERRTPTWVSWRCAQKKWDEALQNLHKAEKLAPKMTGDSAEYRAGGIPSWELSSKRSRHFNPYFEKRRMRVQPRYLLGLCQVFVEDYRRRRLTLEPLWSAMSGDVMYLYVLGVAANQSGKTELDERAMKQLVDVGSNTAEFHLIMAKAISATRRFSEGGGRIEEGGELKCRLCHFYTSILALPICI